MTSLPVSGAAHAMTLEGMKAPSKLKCGVNSGLPGFAAKGAAGTWVGLDVDFCRALASARVVMPARLNMCPLV
jgi:general L-amino acid transport system substrate-binding protein